MLVRTRVTRCRMDKTLIRTGRYLRTALAMRPTLRTTLAFQVYLTVLRHQPSVPLELPTCLYLQPAFIRERQYTTGMITDPDKVLLTFRL